MTAAQLSDLGRRGCECIGCLRLFWGVPAFDSHRTGPHAGGRRCMTDAQMTAAGLAPDERGVWTWTNELERTSHKHVFGVAGRAPAAASSKSA